MDGGEVNSIIVEADPAFVRFRDESRFWIQRVILIYYFILQQYHLFAKALTEVEWMIASTL